MDRAAEARAAARDALLVAAAFGAACALLRARGFDHVSDDDFARVTIAQAFAVAPKVDPSGTSWLPFPFWALGTVMAVVGRSLDVARVASIVFASAAAPLPYLAMRSVGVSRGAALGGAVLALATPWALWLGASTVPESFTASATIAGAILLGARRGEPRNVPLVLGVVAIGVACLSRYEPWPVAAVLAASLARRAVRARSRAEVVAAALVVAAPLAWMIWNQHAHGSAVHFLHRVAKYRRAIGQGSSGQIAEAILLYPRLFVTTRPELLVALLAALPALRRADVRARWGVPLACAAAQVVFLAYGAVNDGAPTHHPARALVAAFGLVACFAADALSEVGARVRGVAVVALAGALVLFGLRGLAGPAPGETAWEDRHPQIARGRSLASASSLVVTPCAYEHFALVAAYGAPERVTTLPGTSAEPTPSCPAALTR